jgi:malonyl-CoA O-methyltransferase
MSDFDVDTFQRVRANFGHAATSYEQHDALQREVQQLLLERLDFYLQQPERVIDVGAGTGRGSALLKKRYAKAR